MCDEVVDNIFKMKEQIRKVEEKEQKKKVRRYELKNRHSNVPIFYKFV